MQGLFPSQAGSLEFLSEALRWLIYWHLYLRGPDQVCAVGEVWGISGYWCEEGKAIPQKVQCAH